MVLELVDELESAAESGKHFETSLARRALDELIDLVVQAAMEVSLCYSHSKLSELSRLIALHPMLTSYSRVCEGTFFTQP